MAFGLLSSALFFAPCQDSSTAEAAGETCFLVEAAIAISVANNHGKPMLQLPDAELVSGVINRLRAVKYLIRR